MINKAAYLTAILAIRFFELVYYIAHVVINVVNKGIMLRCILLTITIVGVSSIKILSQSQDPKCNPIQETHDVTLRVGTHYLINVSTKFRQNNCSISSWLEPRIQPKLLVKCLCHFDKDQRNLSIMYFSEWEMICVTK